MKKFPALAALEFNDIPLGMVTADAMLKRAPIGGYKSGAISRGRYLVLIAGTTASVEESFDEGLRTGGAGIIDQIMLPHVHDAVYAAVFGQRRECLAEALAILECGSVSTHIGAVDQAVKTADVSLLEVRIADGLLWGKSLSILQGELHEIEAAIESAGTFFDNRNVKAAIRKIPMPHEGLVNQIGATTNFADGHLLDLDGEEL